MATSGTGMFGSYDLTTGIIIDMDPLIYTYTPLEAPLLNGVGADGRPIITSAPVDQVKFEQLSEKLLPPRTNMVTDTVDADDTAIAVTAGHGLRFKAGDIVRLVVPGEPEFNEIIRVSSVSTDTLTVARGYNGSTARSYVGLASITKLYGIGNSNVEGSNPVLGNWKDRDTDWNYCQIYGPHSMRATGTTMVVPRYGVPDDFARQLNNRMAESIVAEEQSFIYGVRGPAGTLTSASVRTTGGLLFSIPAANKYDGSGSVGDSTDTPHTLTVADATHGITARLAESYNRGGVPDEIMVNPAALATMNDVDNTSIVRTSLEDPRRGRVSVMWVDTEFGTLDVVRHRYLHPAHAIAWKRAGARRRVLRPHQLEVLGKVGDYHEVMYLAETGWEFKGTEHFFAFVNLNYAAAAEV